MKIEQSRRNYQRGEARWNSKLTEEDVLEIRRLGNPYSPDRLKDEAIAALFFISEGNVGHILKRRTWKELA